MLPDVWSTVSRTQAADVYQLYIGVRQDASFGIYGTLEQLKQYVEEMRQEIEWEERRLACSACEDGWGNDEDHSCELGENGGWGPAPSAEPKHHRMTVVGTAGAGRPSYRSHCLECDAYSSSYWDPADCPTSHVEPY